MEYTKYNKMMVLLSEENRDFAAKSEQGIYGNLRLETGNNKGAISLTVQNLRFFERNRYIYKLILFGEKKERTIHTVIGSLIVNRFGSGENYFRFDPCNVDGKGGSLSDYSIAIVAAVSMKDNKEPLHPVLKGRLGSQGNVLAARTEKKPQPTEEPRNTRTSKDEENRNTKAPEKEFHADNQRTRPQEAMPNNFKEEKVTYNKFYNDYLKELCEKTAKNGEFYDTVTPFAKDKIGATWKRISSVKNFPLVSPGAIWGATKYRHYIFGEDAKCYYLGIPGRFLNEEQPEGGKSGFVLWQPIVGAESLEATKAECSLENRMTAYGYWIAAIEKENGDIVEPK